MMVPGEPLEVKTSPTKIAIMHIKDNRVERYRVKLFDVVEREHKQQKNVKMGSCTLLCTGGSLVDVTAPYVKRAHEARARTRLPRRSASAGI